MRQSEACRIGIRPVLRGLLLLRALPTRKDCLARDFAPTLRAQCCGPGGAAFQPTEPSECDRVRALGRKLLSENGNPLGWCTTSRAGRANVIGQRGFEYVLFHLANEAAATNEIHCRRRLLHVFFPTPLSYLTGQVRASAGGRSRRARVATPDASRGVPDKRLIRPVKRPRYSRAAAHT